MFLTIPRRQPYNTGINLFNAWNRLVGRSGSQSYSGLAGGFLKSLYPTYNTVNQTFTQTLPYIRTGWNPNVYNALSQLTPIAARNWSQAYMPVFNRNLKNTLAGLATRGILDSGTAGRALGLLSQSYANNLGNLTTQLTMNAVRSAIDYPLRAGGLLGGLLGSLGSLGRVGYNRGMTYNPSPAIGFLSSLLGI